jgi:hypothetical protein
MRKDRIMATARGKGHQTDAGGRKKTLKLKKETLRDLAPATDAVRGGVSGSGPMPRGGYKSQTWNNTNQSTG